ncbi:MAG: P-II family nitrogen regulator [Planctomycetes bacterium]|nr:P-II family nitrogen regulator [Planctomycetota bacterium]
MKKLTVYIKPFRLETVLEQLPAEGVVEVLIGEVRGYGRQKGHLEKYREHEYELTFLPKARLEIFVEDEAFAAVEESIRSAARTGRIGDGKILVCGVEQVEAI